MVAANQGREVIEKLRQSFSSNEEASRNEPGALDLVIIGGGPAGISAALEAAKRGWKYVVPTCLLDEFLGTLVKVPNRAGEGQVHRLQRVQSVLPDGCRHQIASLAGAARDTVRYALRGMRRVRDALPDADFVSWRSSKNATRFRDHKFVVRNPI